MAVTKAHQQATVRELNQLRARYLELRGKPTNARDLRSLRRTVRVLESRASTGEDVRARETGHARSRPLSMADRQWTATLELTRVLDERNVSSTIRRALRLLAADVDSNLARDLEET